MFARHTLQLLRLFIDVLNLVGTQRVTFFAALVKTNKTTNQHDILLYYTLSCYRKHEVVSFVFVLIMHTTH